MDPETPQVLTQPPINVANVENFYAFETDLTEHLQTRKVSVNPKSRRRSLRRRLKKIERQAHRLSDDLRRDQFALADDRYDVEM